MATKNAKKRKEPQRISDRYFLAAALAGALAASLDSILSVSPLAIRETAESQRLPLTYFFLAGALGASLDSILVATCL